ncbi:MAG: protein kinase [Pyrinomonadaceae bacterium]|nr:protein kinase [Pyrinomonadaceae bacterium]
MLDQFIGQTLVEKYRVDSILRDGGGLGKVYRATHLLMDTPVTVKILAPALAVDEKIVKQFRQEARTVSHISHQNILNVTDFGADKNGTTYIVFEGADGDTLKSFINREGSFASDRAVKIAQQIAAALSAAHANNIIHRQLNSENILLVRTADNAEIVKILDFGTVQNDDGENNFDSENSTGKLEYLSPEQNSSVAEPDARSDIYSLGVIFYEMLAGEVPFTAENSMDLLLKQANNPPAPLVSFRADLPAAIEPIIIRALAKNPDMRYQTAAEFSRDLTAVADDSGVAESFVVPNVALRENENVKNNLWKTAFVVLAGISLLAISFIYATSSKQTDPTTVLQTDANGQPVQPLNPATGLSEQGAANMMQYPTDMLTAGNSNMMLTQPQAVPNSDGFGDGYNPWARGVPPPGAPMYQMPQGGQMVDPNNPNSIFMQDGTVYVPVPINPNANINANVKPAATPTGKPTPVPVNANTQPTPAPTINPQPSPVKTPSPTAPKPTASPAKTPPVKTEKLAESEKVQDS